MALVPSTIMRHKPIFLPIQRLSIHTHCESLRFSQSYRYSLVLLYMIKSCCRIFAINPNANIGSAFTMIPRCEIGGFLHAHARNKLPLNILNLLFLVTLIYIYPRIIIL